MGYPNHKYFRMSGDICMGYLITSICIRDILWIAYSSPPGAPAALRLSLAAPSGPGRHCPPSLRTILRHCYAPLFSLSHRQAPQTRFAPPKLPQPLVDLVHVASLPARLVGCICHAASPMWKPGAPVLAELVWDGQSRVADPLSGFGSSRSRQTAPVPPCRSAWKAADQEKSKYERYTQSITMVYPWDLLTDKRRDIFSWQYITSYEGIE